MSDLIERLRERTALRYMGSCKCGKCQLVPRADIDEAADHIAALEAEVERLKGEHAKEVDDLCMATAKNLDAYLTERTAKEAAEAKSKENWKLAEEERHDANKWHAEYESATARLAKAMEALADAIRRPMGVIPASAEGVISDRDLILAEQRRIDERRARTALEGRT